MQIYFVTLNSDTQRSFISQIEPFVRSHSPTRFEFSFDPAGSHKIFDYRILWRRSSAEPVAIEVGLDILHLAPTGDMFHLLLNRKIDGLFYVTNASFGDVYSEISQMKWLLPQQLLRQPGLTQGGIYFRDDVESLLPEDLKSLSHSLKLSLYVETPSKIAQTCTDIISKINQSLMRSPKLNPRTGPSVQI